MLIDIDTSVGPFAAQSGISPAYVAPHLARCMFGAPNISPCQVRGSWPFKLKFHWHITVKWN
jgi:hypothetical protein